MANDPRAAKRCAVYTRKSSEDGLEQDFNSLHAQREACEAFIVSQRGEGWKLIPTAYDDGGISGGTMERPALRRLMADIESGLVDVVVVYKVDRLTRSLADFAKMVEVFDRHGVSFVAVTQQFNTTSSMGRLTLNVLLSFAQFEREVTGERIRDKVAASKKKGMWMGGLPSLGYRAVDKKLVVVPEEAELVRKIYQRYLKSERVRELADALFKDGIRSRKGFRIWHGALYTILSNPAYVGRVPHKGKTYPGQQQAIVDDETWAAVQRKLAKGSMRVAGPRVTPESALIGKVFDQNGNSLTTSHTVKRARRYRYYVSRERDRQETDQDSGWRLPSDQFEKQVGAMVSEMVSDRSGVIEAAVHAGVDAEKLSLLLATVAEPNTPWPTRVRRVEVRRDGLSVSVILQAEPEVLMERHFPMVVKRRGVELRLVLSGKVPEVKRDASLIQTIGRAMRWWEMLSTGKAASAAAIARDEGFEQSYVQRLLPLAMLAPELVESIVDGRQPIKLTSMRLIHGEDIPLGWTQQQGALA